MYQKRWLLLKKSPNFLIWALFGKIDRSLEKERFENFRKTPNCASFFSNASRKLLLLIWSEDVQNFVFFLEKNDVFLRKNTWKFSKTLNTDTFLQEVFKSNYCLCNLRTFKVWVLEKNDVFSRKTSSKISGALFGIFYRKCVSQFYIASEFSKQSIFWVFLEK